MEHLNRFFKNAVATAKPTNETIIDPGVIEMKKTLEKLHTIETQSISEKITERLNSAGVSYFANHNIANYIEAGEIELLVDEVAGNLEKVLKSLVIDTTNDHNTQDTAMRVAKMFVYEVFSGRYEHAPKITDFPNIAKYDNLYTAGPITVKSTCAHHFQAIKGRCWIGVFPGEKVIGLSKFNRLVDWYSSRPQIQEELTTQIADEVEKVTEARGVAVIIKAEHMCLTHRGVREHESDMSTSIMRGEFRTDKSLKEEFLKLISMNGKH